MLGAKFNPSTVSFWRTLVHQRNEPFDGFITRVLYVGCTSWKQNRVQVYSWLWLSCSRSVPRPQSMFVLVVSILWLDFFHFNREKFCCFACTRPDTLQQYLFSFLWWTEKDTELPSQPITALPSVVYNHAVLFIVCLWCVCFSMLFRKHICDAPLCKDIFFIGATKKGERLRSFSCKSGHLLGYS